MDEARIKALYRRHTLAAAPLPEADDIAHMLSHHGAPADEVTALDRVAANGVASDIARLVAGLGPDIDALAGDLRQTRRTSSPLRRFARRGFALAAGVGAFAVLFALMPRPGEVAPAAPLPEADSIIMSMSFEPGEASRALDNSTETAIFKGNFDS